jgi:cell division protein FtsN
MSTQDDGYGRQAGPNPGSQSGFNDNQSLGGAPGVETWGNNALNAQKSEVSLMAHGAGRPGQPAGGQRPMFGGGSPVFAQMPVYTPVTRGPEAAPPPPQAPQPAYNPYAAPQPSQPPASGHGYPNPQTPSPLAYPSANPPAAPNYQGSQPAAAPNYHPAPQQPQPSYQTAAPQSNYQTSAPSPQPNYQTAPSPQPGHQPAAPSGQPHYLDIQGLQSGPSHQPADFSPQSYRPAAQPGSTQGFSAGHAAPQTYPGTGYGDAQGFAPQPYQDQSFADASFPEPPSNDASFPESSFDQNFAEPAFGNQTFAKANFGDASFPEPQNFDTNFADAGFPATPSYGHQPQNARADQSFEAFTEETAQDYGMAAGEVPQSDPRRQLQAFDALYDQPPQIALGSTEPRRAAQDFYESERLDADFLDEGQAVPPPAARSKFAIGGRSIFMVGSALLGAIALGGALAFAYKQSGGGLSNGEPPLVTADNRPVKEMPEEPGGKEFPHKNKLIYDRLTNGEEPEAERLVPRQENVAVPALPPSLETAGMPQPVASTDLGVPPTTQAVGGDQMAVASVDDGTMPDGGPRRVKTMVVRPDGSMMEQEPSAAIPEMPGEPQMLAATPPPSAPQGVAALPPPPPPPAPQAAPQQTAAAAPQAAAAAAPTKFVVQVGAHKSQAEALAIYADIQQKNPALLGGYSPMLQKASVSGGTMYRLRVGPMENKGAADKLCQQLKAQGTDCFVASQ